jgi:hypothetical protein
VSLLEKLVEQGFAFRKTFSFLDVERKACFWLGFSSIFFGIDPKKKQKKSRAKDAASALFLRLEKLEKTSKSFFCFSTAPKFTPTPARLLPKATALYKASFYVPSAWWVTDSTFNFPFSTLILPHPFFVANHLKKAPLERGQEFKTTKNTAAT